MSNVKELILKNRSIRRFKENEIISTEILKALVELARLSPSASNKQPLKYIISNESERNNKIFKHLSWAGYLSDWSGPVEGERPAAYIIICNDKRIDNGNIDCDHGIAAQSILLGAVELGYNGCIIASVNRSALCNDLAIPDHLSVLLVLALGAANEQVRIEPTDGEHGIKYWRDENSVHHVPKRSLDEVIFILY
ncbi:MAG: nitroreductase family protein [Calditrichaceae bacterium]|nr:nitroreductase family protein [Calditrichaceae bacterium]